MLLHIVTEKGRGYEPALAKPDKFHGLGQYKIETGETEAAALPTYSDYFGTRLAARPVSSAPSPTPKPAGEKL